MQRILQWVGFKVVLLSVLGVSTAYAAERATPASPAAPAQQQQQPAAPQRGPEGITPAQPQAEAMIMEGTIESLDMKAAEPYLSVKDAQGKTSRLAVDRSLTQVSKGRLEDLKKGQRVKIHATEQEGKKSVQRIEVLE